MFILKDTLWLFIKHMNERKLRQKDIDKYTDTYLYVYIYTYKLGLTFTNVGFFLPGNLFIEGSIGLSHSSEKLGCQL